jgi:hypothetical protein
LQQTIEHWEQIKTFLAENSRERQLQTAHLSDIL